VFQVELGHVTAQQDPVVDVFEHFQIRIRDAQDFFQAEIVKGAEPNAFGALADRFHDTRFHLAGGFIGKRQAKDVFAGKLGIAFQEIANAFGDDSRFTGSGTGDDEKRALAVFHSATLLCVEGGETFPRGGQGHEPTMIAEFDDAGLRFSFASELRALIAARGSIEPAQSERVRQNVGKHF
jgi:hypothetical protein